jgi:septal ring factor EnvC (AmiA/AmiB activator)
MHLGQHNFYQKVFEPLMMRYSAKLPTACRLGILLLFVGLGLAISANQAFAARLSPKSKLTRINQAIAQQQNKVRENTTKAFNLEQELKELDKKLADEQEKLQNVQQKLNRQESDLESQIKDAALVSKEKEALESHIKKRLSAYYKMGEVTVINTLFAAKSMPEFLNLKEYFQAMFHYDQQIVKHYRAKLFLISEAQKNIQQNKKRLLKFIELEKVQEQQLITTRQERNQLLAQINTQKELYQQALAEMEQSAANLKEVIDKLKIPIIRAKTNKIYKKKSHKHKPPLEPTGFAAAKGHLPKPVSGRISRYFGSQSGEFGIKIQSTGWDFETKENAAIQAIYAGKIIFSDKMAGYGKMLIIDHGQQYYTLIAGISTFLKEKGDSVQAGDIIARTGTTGNMLTRGLHFEIRHRSQTLDPIQWIDKSQFATPK